MSTGSPRPVEDEIARIEQQMAEVERTGPTLAELEQRVIAQLDEAARYYRAHGFELGGVLSGERAHNDRLAMIGALVSVNRNELIAIEVARVRAAFDAAGARGTTKHRRRSSWRCCAVSCARRMPVANSNGDAARKRASRSSGPTRTLKSS